MIKLVCVCHSLGPGGAERVLSTLASYWVTQGHQVTIVTFDPGIEDFFPLDAKVNRVVVPILGGTRSALQSFRNNLFRIRSLRRIVMTIRPDAVVAFMDPANALSVMACLGTSSKIVISERTNPAIQKVPFPWSFVNHAAYRLADVFVLQTQAIKKWYADKGIAKNTAVIPNPVHIGPASKFSQATRQQYGVGTDDFLVVAAGRLSAEKGFDCLLEAFALHKKHDCKQHSVLVIAGDGPERSSLLNQIDNLGLVGVVHLVGKVAPLEELLGVADLFVLTSRYEGFPNVLVEAMALGRAVIAFDCSFGPREIIADGQNGVLVPNGNVDALAKAMTQLLRDAALRSKLGAQARVACGRFELSRVSTLWMSVLSA